MGKLHFVVRHCLQVVPDPKRTELTPFQRQADPKDLPLLVAALQANCTYLLTFNTRHYFPPEDTILIQTPGQFLQTARSKLAQMQD